MDELVAAGVVPEGTVWHEFMQDVFPGIGGSMGLRLSSANIDALAERANGECLGSGSDAFNAKQQALDDRQAREMRALEEEEQALWGEHTEAPPLMGE